MSSEAAGRPDVLVRALSEDGGVSVRALTGRELAREGAQRQGTSPVATRALARTLLGAVLLASGQDEEETVQLQFRGHGPLGPVTAIADGRGRARGFVTHPEADVPLRRGRLDVAGAIGVGVLAVVRFRPGWREPYNGIVPIQSGEIASDLAHYLAESEQKPSALALGEFQDRSGAIEAAGGFLVQALPDADDETVERVDVVVRGLPPVSELMAEGLGAPDLAKLLLAGVGMRELETSEPIFHCPCTRERVLRTMVLLGPDELRAIRRDGESVETHCRFCGERYLLASDELGALAPDA
ncbi:MAG: Hsp33 family molecular chaperone HslO [Deltaproteobacteria bacterium]|nr:Hsp33 family molecular chaperone HslO [Deltaproteobacteria bacterium]MBW2448235.1 Hsp33 family molecular chaperone HslO [Deltaproteobacteria bacterium]